MDFKIVLGRFWSFLGTILSQNRPGTILKSSQTILKSRKSPTGRSWLCMRLNIAKTGVCQALHRPFRPPASTGGPAMSAAAVTGARVFFFYPLHYYLLPSSLLLFSFFFSLLINKSAHKINQNKSK